MKYFDKSLQRAVDLTESQTEFLLLAKPGEMESIAAPLLSQRVFSVTASNIGDGVFVLRVSSESESPIAIDKSLSELKSDNRVEDVVPALIDRDGNVRFSLPARVIVRFRDTKDATVKSILDKKGSEILRKFSSTGMFEVSVPLGADLGEFINELNANPRVIFAEPSFYGVNDMEVKVKISYNSFDSDGTNGEHGKNSPSLGDSYHWNLERVSAYQAWQLTKGRPEIVVGIVDGLPEVDHEAIKGKFLVPIDDAPIFGNDRSVSSHATNICSVVAAESDRLLGVSPDLRLLPIVVNLQAQSYAERADAIHMAADAARKRSIGGTPFLRLVLSCSWRTSGDITVIRTAIEEAVDAGVLLVFSAGNDGNNSPHYPSEYSRSSASFGDGVIAVAATTEFDKKASYSNFSPSVDLCAPGGDGLPFDDRDILCADQGNSYLFAAGTSIAAPHVAALAAMLLSLQPDLTPVQIKRILKENADDISAGNPQYLNMLGTGRINARKALERIGSDPIQPQPSSDVKDRLRTYALELKVATGWTIDAANLSRGQARATLEL